MARNLNNQLGPGYNIDVVSWPDMPTDWQAISSYDLVMMQRPYMGSMLDFCKRVKTMNVPLWLDYDDNMFCVTGENRAWMVFNDPVVAENVKQMIMMADIVTVTNEDLRQSYLPLNKNTVVIPNAFNDTIFNVDRIPQERENIVVWRGSDTHIYDVMAYSPSITKCANDFPEYEFTYVGYNPWFLEQTKNTSFIKPKEIIDYFNDINKIAPAVVQVPLHDTLFNRCKSNIAFIEGSYWGAVSIVPEFWGELPGSLSYTDQASYYEALRSVLAGEVDVVKMNEVAWQYVKDNLLLSKINKLRVKIVKQLLKK